MSYVFFKGKLVTKILLCKIQNFLFVCLLKDTHLRIFLFYALVQITVSLKIGTTKSASLEDVKF